MSPLAGRFTRKHNIGESVSVAMLRPFVSIFQARIVMCSAGRYRANAFASKHREETDPSELR